MPRKLLVALCVIAIPFVLAACGDDDDTTSAAAPETTAAESTTAESTTTAASGGETVDIAETEYKLDPSDATVKAGSVTFNVSNDGSTVHNLEIEGNGVEEETEDLQPGASGELTVDLKPGSYEMYCSIDGHEDLGMKGEVTVQ